MLRIANKEWNEARLEEGCKMLGRGIGLKIAAREVCSCCLLVPHKCALQSAKMPV
jgi:hypothetical protein